MSFKLFNATDDNQLISSIIHLQNSEIVSLNTNSTDTTVQFEGWTMGATSSCINDIANDDFAQILHIEEVKGDDDSGTDESVGHAENIPMLKSKLKIPNIRTSVSDNSLSHMLDLAESIVTSNENSFLTIPSMGAAATAPNMSEMKASGSDVSISFFLDRDDAGEAFDENTFANVNSNTLLEPTRKKSNVNVTFLLDDQD